MTWTLQTSERNPFHYQNIKKIKGIGVFLSFFYFTRIPLEFHFSSSFMLLSLYPVFLLIMVWSVLVTSTLHSFLIICNRCEGLLPDCACHCLFFGPKRKKRRAEFIFRWHILEQAVQINLYPSALFSYCGELWEKLAGVVGKVSENSFGNEIVVKTNPCEVFDFFSVFFWFGELQNVFLWNDQLITLQLFLPFHGTSSWGFPQGNMICVT